MPAGLLNLNAARTGRRMSRLVVGELPRQLNWLRTQARKYRRDLEQVTVEVHGEVGVWHAHLIDSAVQGFIHAGTCRWILREKFETLKNDEIMNCSKEVQKAKQERNRAVKQLDLDKREVDQLDQLYSLPEATQPNNEHEDQEATDSSDEEKDLEIARQKARERKRKRKDKDPSTSR